VAVLAGARTSQEEVAVKSPWGFFIPLLVVLGVWLGGLVVDEPFHPKLYDLCDGRWVWMYDFGESPGWDNYMAIRKLRDLRVDGVFLSISHEKPLWQGTEDQRQLSGYALAIADFVERAHAVCIEVYASTLEDPHFALVEKTETWQPWEIANHLTPIFDYNKTVGASEAFDGIHIDVEPHTMEPKSGVCCSKGDSTTSTHLLWVSDVAVRTKIMDQYEDLHEEVRGAIDKHNSDSGDDLRFASAFTWYYNHVYTTYKVASANPAVLAKYVDMSVVMVEIGKDDEKYRDIEDIKDWTIARAKPFIDVGPTLVGIYLSDYEDKEYVWDVIAEIEVEFGRTFSGAYYYPGIGIGNCVGVCVDNYDSWDPLLSLP